MEKAHNVQKLSFCGTRMFLAVDGKNYEIEVAKYSRKLAGATPEQKEHFCISPSGYGLHWPDLDEDLSIDGLLGVKHLCPQAESTAR